MGPLDIWHIKIYLIVIILKMKTMTSVVLRQTNSDEKLKGKKKLITKTPFDINANKTKQEMT